MNLQRVDSKCTFYPSKIEMVGTKNVEVPKLVAQTQLVVCLEFVAMAGSANTLKVFAAVGIARS